MRGDYHSRRMRFTKGTMTKEAMVHQRGSGGKMRSPAPKMKALKHRRKS
jgi:hypothetical protein